MAVGKGSIKRIENASITKESAEEQVEEVVPVVAKEQVEEAVPVVAKKTRKPRAKQTTVDTKAEKSLDNEKVVTGVVEDLHEEKFRLISNIKSDLPDHLL
ncbi:MAG: hypothetical protein ACLRZ7_12205 [Lachnospiraceae bacterium]